MGFFTAKADARLIALWLLFMASAVLVYSQFFDILIPGLPSDSYRAMVGPYFFIPIMLLVLGQSSVTGFVCFVTAQAAVRKADFLRALVIGAALTFWFSLTYAWFPKYGPFYYIVFVSGEAPWYALPVEIAWTAGGIVIGTVLCRRLLHLSWRLALLTAVLGYLFITVAAS